MACFGAPMTVAIVTTMFRKRIPAKWHVEWLNMLLWGGSAGLALEHYAHQEIVPYFPYLTALGTSAGTVEMIQEVAVVGGSMLLACISAWLVMVFIASRMENTTKQIATQ